MVKCDACGKTILFGGVKGAADGRPLRFCSNTCRENWQVSATLGQFPPEAVEKYVAEFHAGTCPRCQGPGPVDAHPAHSVVSLLIVTRWKTESRLSCRACGTKHQATALASSLLFGWWGFPWGLIMTPVQVTRTAAALFKKPDPAQPSAQGRGMMQTVMVRQWHAYRQAQAPSQSQTAGQPPAA